MTYTLYGSLTSPFVRRIRMLMEDIPYDFKEIDIFGPDKELLQTINPINQIPVLLHGDQKIWDSRQIFNYLSFFHEWEKMSWDQENRLTAIESAMNAAVAILLLKRSGIKLESNIMYLNRQVERIESVLDYLQSYLSEDALKIWNFESMTLYSFLDWASFREIIDLSKRPECQKFLDTYAEKAIVKETQIPRG